MDENLKMRSSKLSLSIVGGALLFIFVSCVAHPVIRPTETVILPTIGIISTKESTITAPAPITPVPTTFLEPTENLTETALLTTPNPYLTPIPTLRPTIEKDMNPLTGLLVENFQNLYRRPVMVKISNYPREIRPQSGLSRADMVFEYYLGSGMNRFLAVFYSEDAEWAGPIRSGRLVDAQLAQMYHAILVYGGADDRVNEIIISPEVLGARAVDTRINEVCPPICGEDTHSLEGVFVDTRAMTEYAKENQFEESQKVEQLNSLAFSTTPQNISGEAVKLMVDISEVCKSQWIYDPDAEKYFRWEETEDFEYKFTPTTDRLVMDAPIGVENIILLFSDYVAYDALLHDIEVVYEDEIMPALMFRDGVFANGFWKAKTEDTPLQLLDENYESYLLKPGKSWLIFVTAESEYESIEEGVWNLDFTRP